MRPFFYFSEGCLWEHRFLALVTNFRSQPHFPRPLYSRRTWCPSGHHSYYGLCTTCWATDPTSMHSLVIPNGECTDWKQEQVALYPLTFCAACSCGNAVAFWERYPSEIKILWFLHKAKPSLWQNFVAFAFFLVFKQLKALSTLLHNSDGLNSLSREATFLDLDAPKADVLFQMFLWLYVDESIIYSEKTSKTLLIRYLIFCNIWYISGNVK